MYLTTKGLVLRVSPYNDSDAMLTVLTSDHGKISAKVRGLRRRNSPMTAPCQLLAYGQFTFFEYKGSFTVNEASSVEMFDKLRRDLTKLSLGTYFAQVAEVLSQEDLPNPELLSLVLNCLYGLAGLDLDQMQVKAVFELRSACLAGYFPDLSGCHICANQYPDLFLISEGRLECSACRNRSFQGIRFPITAGILSAMRYICHCTGKKLFQFSLPQEAMSALADLTESYLCTQLERSFSTLDFYKSLLYTQHYPD